MATNTFSDANETVTATANTHTGNVLSNTTNATAAQVTAYTINGMQYKAGETAAIYGLGTFKLENSGNYTFSVEGQRNAGTTMPKVTYTVQNGSVTETSDLTINLGGGVTAKPYAEADAAANVYVDLDTRGTIVGGQASGNILSAYTGADKPYISGFRVGNAYYASGQTVSIENLGEVTVNRDGTYTVTGSDLAAGAEVPVIAFTLSNGTVASSSDILLSVSAATPALTDADENYAAVSGNVLANAANAGGTLGVTSIVEGGHTYGAGDIIQFDGGTMQIKGNGDYVFTSNGAYTVYTTPEMTYTVSDGTQTDTSKITVSYDWGHLEGGFGSDMPDTGKVIAGDNQSGTGSTTIVGNANNTDLLVGDAYDTTALSNIVVGGSRAASAASDVLVGDRLNIDHLSWQSGGATVSGSSYANSIEGLRAYLKSTGAAGTDAEVVQYVRANYAQLADTNAQGGNDTLRGSYNDDILIGNAGNDTLIGSAGKDIFAFTANSNSGKDVITDFTRGYDKIVFTDAVDVSKLQWNAETSVLSFTGTKDGQTYQNSITVQNAPGDLALNELLNANAAG